nr:transcriptional repressor [Caudoviricetes sp.]
METKERMMQLIAALGLSKAEFERVCGLSNGYVNSIRNTIGSKGVAQIIAQFPQVNKSWLVFGEGEMFNDNASPEQPNDPMPLSDEQRCNNVAVGGNASNISNGTSEKTILFALTEVSEMRKLLAEVIGINKEQSKRLVMIVDKIADRI